MRYAIEYQISANEYEYSSCDPDTDDACVLFFNKSRTLIDFHLPGSLLPSSLIVTLQFVSTFHGSPVLTWS